MESITVGKVGTFCFTECGENSGSLKVENRGFLEGGERGRRPGSMDGRTAWGREGLKDLTGCL